MVMAKALMGIGLSGDDWINRFYVNILPVMNRKKFALLCNKQTIYNRPELLLFGQQACEKNGRTKQTQM